jgi:hypothetical protein
MLPPNSGTIEQRPAPAREPASMHPDLIRTTGPDIRVMREATGVTPNVGSLIGEDPIKADFAASLAHPGDRRTHPLVLFGFAHAPIPAMTNG